MNTLSPEESLRFLFRLDQKLYKIQSKQAVEYDDGIHTKHRHTRYHDFFVCRINHDERVLDVGCGIGALAYDVAEKAEAYVVGIDIDPGSIARAQKLFSHQGVEYRIGDIRTETLETPFDVVIFSNVLEHLLERVKILRLMREVACPDRILIRVPLFDRDWRVPLKRELGVEWRLDQTHETEYTQESFADEMTAAGLTVTYMETRWGEIWAETVSDGS